MNTQPATPSPYTRSTLLHDAQALLGIGELEAGMILDVLADCGFITDAYGESHYLPEELYPAAQAFAARVAAVMQKADELVDVQPHHCSTAWNSAALGPHPHAIIPALDAPLDTAAFALSIRELAVFHLIATRFLALFRPALR